MTISTSVGERFTIDTVVRLAYHRAGLVTVGQVPTLEQTQYGRSTLDEIMDGLGAHGNLARVTEFLNVAITAGVTEYEMPNTVLDLLNPAMYIDATNTDVDFADGETPIDLITEQAWTRLSSKAAAGRPIKFYADRTKDLIKAVLWPVPSEVGATVRFYVQRKLADASDGNATLDLQNYWMRYIITILASELAQAGSLDQKAAALFGKAQMFLRLAKGKANERPGNQMYMTHDGGWNA